MTGDALGVAGEQRLEVAGRPRVARVAREPEGGLGLAAAQRELDVTAQIGATGWQGERVEVIGLQLL